MPSVRAIYSFFIIKSAQVPIKNPVVAPASSAMKISPWSAQPFARKSSTIRSLSSADKNFLETITWFLFLCVNYTHYVDFCQYDFNIYPLIIVPHFGCTVFLPTVKNHASDCFLDSMVSVFFLIFDKVYKLWYNDSIKIRILQ